MKKVFNTLSDFALKILTLHSLTNSVFNIMKDLFKSTAAYLRVGKSK